MLRDFQATHVIFEPVDFIAKLAALVPKPRVNLTHFHGVFAPNSKHRAVVTPAKRARVASPKQRMAKRRKRQFNVFMANYQSRGN